MWNVIFSCHFGSYTRMVELHLVCLLSCPPTETHTSHEHNPPIYLVLIESRKVKVKKVKNVCCISPPSWDCMLAEHFKSNVLNKAYNNLDNQPSPVPEVPIMSQLTLSQSSTDPDNHLSSPRVEFQTSVSKSFQFAVEWKCCLSMYLNHYLHIKRTEQASVYGFEDFFSSSFLCLKEPLDKCVCVCSQACFNHLKEYFSSLQLKLNWQYLWCNFDFGYSESLTMEVNGTDM